MFMTGTGARGPGVGIGIVSMLSAALPALTANLALELAPVRVNLIAAGFGDTPLSAHCSATTSNSDATSYAPYSLSGVSSDPPRSPPSPGTS